MGGTGQIHLKVSVVSISSCIHLLLRLLHCSGTASVQSWSQASNPPRGTPPPLFFYLGSFILAGTREISNPFSISFKLMKISMSGNINQCKNTAVITYTYSNTRQRVTELTWNRMAYVFTHVWTFPKILNGAKICPRHFFPLILSVAMATVNKIWVKWVKFKTGIKHVLLRGHTK